MGKGSLIISKTSGRQLLLNWNPIFESLLIKLDIFDFKVLILMYFLGGISNSCKSFSGFGTNSTNLDTNQTG
jgi:hypothetical protein